MKPIHFDRPTLLSGLRSGAETLQLPLSDRQCDRLLDYMSLLSKWNSVYNLTAIRDPGQMLVQHLLDSLAAVPAFTTAERVLDVGSGGGLPGMVLAIWAQESRPAMQVSLIDTVHKKTAFLTQVKAELGLSNVVVHTGRVEQLSPDRQFDVITSRAFADLSDFVQWAGHLLAPGGRFIALKGVAPAEELDRLPADWKVVDKQALQVPGLNAERHLVFIERAREPT
jgi:16S rRNA (guanine527-N7)-methyltransferase